MFLDCSDLVFTSICSSCMFQERQKRGDDNLDAFLADIYAHRAMFSEAGKLYKKTGNEQKALNMYTDLRMFELAKVN